MSGNVCIYQSCQNLSSWLHHVPLRLEEAQSQHVFVVQRLQEQMGHLVPGAREAELQHLLNLKEEAGRRLNAQQVGGDVSLQAASLGAGIRGKEAGMARDIL